MHDMATLNCHSSYFLFYLQIKRKRKRTEDSLIMRTFSISAALPEDENDDLFDESDSEIEYQLQIKPKALSLGANTNSVNIAMDVVASPIKKESEFNIISGNSYNEFGRFMII